MIDNQKSLWEKETCPSENPWVLSHKQEPGKLLSLSEQKEPGKLLSLSGLLNILFYSLLVPAGRAAAAMVIAAVTATVIIPARGRRRGASEMVFSGTRPPP